MILGTAAFGTGVLGAGETINPFTITAVASATTASVALTVTGLDYAQYVTITRQDIDAGTSTQVRGANQQATFQGLGYVLGSNILGTDDSSFESSLGSWSPQSNINIFFQSSTFAYTGLFSMELTAASNGQMEATLSGSPIPVVADNTYYFSYWLYTPNTGCTATIDIDYWTATGGTFISSDNLATQGLTNVALNENGWTQVTIISTAPVGAGIAYLNICPIAQSTGNAFYVDNVFFGTYAFTGVTSGTFSVTDYECPLNTLVEYTADLGILVEGVPTNVTGTVSNEVELNVPDGTAWLKNVTEPFFNQQVTIAAMSDAVYTSRSQATYVIGRSNPIILMDAIGGRSGTVTFLTQALTDKSQLLSALTSPYAQVLFLQVAAIDGFADLYFSINSSITENRPAGVAGDPTRLWPVTFLEVDSPSDEATAVGANTWLDVLKWSTWQDLLDQRPTWESVLLAPFGTYPGDTP